MDIPTLTTSRLFLRAPGAADTPAMLAFLGSQRAKFYGGPMMPGEAWQKYAAYVGQWRLRGYGLFVIELRSSGETLGMVGPYHPGDFTEPEMSWLLTDGRHEGKGYAFEACTAVLNHLFVTLGWSSVVSFIDDANSASRRLAERLGARLDHASPAPIANCASFRHFATGVLA